MHTCMHMHAYILTEGLFKPVKVISVATVKDIMFLPRLAGSLKVHVCRVHYTLARFLSGQY